jgi:hypothetical protein
MLPTVQVDLGEFGRTVVPGHRVDPPGLGGRDDGIRQAKGSRLGSAIVEEVQPAGPWVDRVRHDCGSLLYAYQLADDLGGLQPGQR